jgi:comEA protein
MHFTREERTILVTILIAAVAGLLINRIFSYSGRLNNPPRSCAPKLLNINAASAEELDALPGIGKVTAKRIVDYREKNGYFKDADGLLKVKGITPKKLAKFRQYIEAL